MRRLLAALPLCAMLASSAAALPGINPYTLYEEVGRTCPWVSAPEVTSCATAADTRVLSTHGPSWSMAYSGLLESAIYHEVGVWIRLCEVQSNGQLSEYACQSHGAPPIPSRPYRQACRSLDPVTLLPGGSGTWTCGTQHLHPDGESEVAVTEDAHAPIVAVSVFGDAEGMVAVSAMGDARGRQAAVAMGDASSFNGPAVSVEGNATVEEADQVWSAGRLSAVSVFGDAEGNHLAVSVFGHARSHHANALAAAISACDAAGVCWPLGAL